MWVSYGFVYKTALTAGRPSVQVVVVAKESNSKGPASNTASFIYFRINTNENLCWSNDNHSP